MDSDFSDYIFEDDGNAKRKKADELLNESAESFAEEQELENLLNLVCHPLDISEKTLDTIHKLRRNTNSNLSINVLHTIKSKRKKRILIWSFSAAAAILFLSFILINLGGSSYFEINISSRDKNFIIDNEDGSKNVKQGSTVKGAAEIKFPKGVIAKSSENAVYRFIDSNSEFLILEEGEIEISVESRKEKSPLYFKIPHATVKVIGTSFIIRCNKDESEVIVREGVVEFETEHGSEKVAAGESRSSDSFTDLEVLPEPESKLKLSFETLKETVDYSGFPELVSGRFGKCIRFDGTTSAVIYRSKDIKDESIAFWVKSVRDIAKAQSILSQHDKSGSFNGFHIYRAKDKLFLQFKDRTQAVDRSLTFTKNKWYHLAFTRNREGDYSLFVDAVLVFNGSFKYTYNNDKLSLGKSPDVFWKTFEGFIDELRIFDRVLSVEEVQKLYQQK